MKKKILCAAVMKVVLLTPTTSFAQDALTNEEDTRMKAIVSLCSEAVVGKILQDDALARAKGLEMHFALIQSNGSLKEVTLEEFTLSQTLVCFTERGREDPILKHRFVPVSATTKHLPPNT